MKYYENIILTREPLTEEDIHAIGKLIQDNQKILFTTGEAIDITPSVSALVNRYAPDQEFDNLDDHVLPFADAPALTEEEIQGEVERLVDYIEAQNVEHYIPTPEQTEEFARKRPGWLKRIFGRHA